MKTITCIENFKDGDLIQGFYLCVEKHLRHTRSGDLFLDLQLRDKTGSINGKIWNNVEKLNKKFNAGAVLIRGIYPELGIDLMTKFRNNTKINNLTNGPGKLTQALDISLKENGHDLTKYSSLYIIDGLKTKKIHRKSRIGISRGLDKKWNFSIDICDYF